jgi:hypothetical protein
MADTWNHQWTQSTVDSEIVNKNWVAIDLEIINEIYVATDSEIISNDWIISSFTFSLG